jgi:hypothetical protein
MLSERYFGTTLYPREMRPDLLEDILYRFGNEFDREQSSDKIKLMSQSTFGSILLKNIGESFKPEVTPSECPHYKLVLAGSLLAGKINPSDIERLNKVLCGNIMKDVNTIGEFGPLSGRRGTDYRPLSQCWKTTIELARLVEFMKQKETVPLISNAVDNETKLREVLNERERVINNNEKRQMVFSVWNEVRPVISKWLDEKTEIKMLPESEKPVSPDEKALMVIKRAKDFDSSTQLNVGGPEYQEITIWVEDKVLNPLKTIVGEKNLSLYLTKNPFLFIEDTAEKCSKKPHGGFMGEMSIL